MNCYFKTCQKEAYIALHRKLGVIDVCKEHYDAVAKKDAKDWCEANGLRTVEQLRAYVKSAKLFQTEPGALG